MIRNSLFFHDVSQAISMEINGIISRIPYRNSILLFVSGFYESLERMEGNLGSTLVCRIDVHAGLLILRKDFPLHGLILVWTFIVFEKFPPARLFQPACALVFALQVY